METVTNRDANAPDKNSPEYLEYLKERGEKIKNEKWEALTDAFAKECPRERAEEIVSKLRALQGMFSSRNAVWLARLYDPKIGGWYWSNSARDNDEFLPDIEDTYTALCFIGSSGMSEMYGGDWVKAIPDWLKKKVGDYISGCQNEDGFFYNIQWPKEFISEDPARRQPRVMRDVGSAQYVLKKLGITPKYSTEQKKEEKEKKDDAPRMLSQFESVENFKEYMQKIEDEILAIDDANNRAAKYYYYGNMFQSVTSYLNNNEEMKKIFIDFLERHQNPETGLWADIVCYHATNALHKIADVANKIGYKLRYIDKMVDTVMKIIAITPEEIPAAGGVYIYNAWSCFPYIYENILTLGDGTDEERIEKKKSIKSRILDNAPALIENAARQLEGFAREDGSFSYGRKGGGGTAQGCPICLPGILEGDMNGNVIAVNAVRRHILKALEVGEYEVPVFTEYERVLFMNILEELNSSADK